MKIIFNSEEQMDNFCHKIGWHYCPNDLGFGGATHNTMDCERGFECSECWKNCGIEMEVANHES